MNWKHLLYAIPLCLVIGFIFGFYINIPKHITIDTGENLKSVVAEFKEMVNNLSTINFNQTYNYYNITNVNYSCDYQNYNSITNEIKSKVDRSNSILTLLYYWKDDSFCNFCKDKENNLDYYLYGNNTDRYIMSINGLWVEKVNGSTSKDKILYLKGYELRNILTKINVDEYIEIWRTK